MPFDKIIMNPPYSGSLHLKILREAMKHVEKEGEVICLHPENQYDSISSYFSPKNKCADFCWRHMKDFSRDVDKRLFGSGLLECKLIVGIYDGSMEMRPPKYTDLEKSIYTKVRHKCYCAGSGFDNIRVKAENLRKWHQKFVEFVNDCEKIDDLLVGDESRASYGIDFDTKEELENWRNFVTKSKITRYLFAKGFRDILVHKTWDYKKPWKDADLYEYFDLNEEEIKEIENAI